MVEAAWNHLNCKWELEMDGLGSFPVHIILCKFGWFSNLSIFDCYFIIFRIIVKFTFRPTAILPWITIENVYSITELKFKTKCHQNVKPSQARTQLQAVGQCQSEHTEFNCGVQRVHQTSSCYRVLNPGYYGRPPVHLGIRKM